MLEVLRQNYDAQQVVRFLTSCDNQAVVPVSNSGRTRDLTLAAIARNIFIEVAKFDMDL